MLDWRRPTAGRTACPVYLAGGVIGVIGLVFLLLAVFGLGLVIYAVVMLAYRRFSGQLAEYRRPLPLDLLESDPDGLAPFSP